MVAEREVITVPPEALDEFSPRAFVNECLAEADSTLQFDFLSKRQQKIFALKFYHGHTLARIAPKVGLKSRQGVKYQLQNTLDEIASRLPEERIEAFYACFYQATGTKSEPVKRNLSKINLGKKLTADHRANISKAIQGTKIRREEIALRRKARQESMRQQFAHLIA